MVAAMVFALRYMVVRGSPPRNRRTAHASPAAGECPEPRRGWTRWRSIIKHTYRRADDDRLLAVAAGVVFYGLVAFFPAITAQVSLYALMAGPQYDQSAPVAACGYRAAGDHRHRRY